MKTSALTSPRRGPIERIEGLTRQEFEAEFRSRSEPVVMVGFARDWLSGRAWTLENIESIYGDLEVPVTVDLPMGGSPYLRPNKDHRRRMTVRGFLEKLRSAAPDRPCYIDSSNMRSYPELMAEVDFRGYTNHPVEAGSTYLWLGSSNTRSGLHFDPSENFLVQVFGKKKAMLVAPDDPASLYPMEPYVSKSKVDPEDPDLSAFPGFARVEIKETVLEPGDLLFIPRFWWHHLRSLENSISVNHWFPGTDASLAWQMVKVLNACGPRYWWRTMRDFVAHGLLRIEFEPNLYTPQPLGVILYKALSTGLRRVILRR
ncbi:cupin-like domain-containing protein [Paraliomyxa miuraensis]|uniref:cupin-like domain-containing protein n=1 Tax=Paraliomyxa miuraensis TaxID=376150 RepID=UPI002250CAF5|nr:cupin-like domain-containing protein [Paraliomyxa miuraensis]MCX4247325.1 cupin-like domain-containing protein [Paraliomyxa miuraensis]